MQPEHAAGQATEGEPRVLEVGALGLGLVVVDGVGVFVRHLAVRMQSTDLGLWPRHLGPVSRGLLFEHKHRHAVDQFRNSRLVFDLSEDDQIIFASAQNSFEMISIILNLTNNTI